MANLQDSLQALCASPEDAGLKLFVPLARTDAPPMPLEVTSVKLSGELVELSWQGIVRCPSRFTLVPGDVIWHQLSNMVAMVMVRMDQKRVMAGALVAPTEEEEWRGLEQSGGGKGVWCVVAQAWRHDWELPKEMQTPTIVDPTAPEAKDYIKGLRHRDPWIRDPARMSSKVRAFYRRQAKAMAEMADPSKWDEPETQLPDPEQVEAEGVVKTFIPLEGPKPKGQVISFPGQTKRSKTDPER